MGYDDIRLAALVAPSLTTCCVPREQLGQLAIRLLLDRINGAGGAKKEATTSEQLSFFDLSEEAVRWVFDLNFTDIC